ncbi:MAG: hypothetical protein AAB676_10945 [Verrucomicrobiota bacterium]
MYNKDTRQPEKLRAWQSASHPAMAGRAAAGEETADSAHATTGVRIGEQFEKSLRPSETKAAFLPPNGQQPDEFFRQ